MMFFYIIHHWKISTDTLREVPFFSIGATFGLLGTIFVFIIVSNPFNEWSSLWYRWQLQEASIKMLFQSLGRGVGVGGFRIYLEALPLKPDRTMPAHSWLANLLSEQGIVGTITFLFAYSRTLDKLLEKYLEDGRQAALALLGSMMAFLISGIGPSVPLIMQTHWIVWGIALVYVYAE